jgi:hypothetical protein
MSQIDITEPEEEDTLLRNEAVTRGSVGMIEYIRHLYTLLPITVTAWFEVCNVCAHSKALIVGSKPTQGMYVWVYSMCFLVKIVALRKADLPFKWYYKLPKIKKLV